ncbi:hypothetical protein Dimus_025822 [Dionaea muscipula]
MSRQFSTRSLLLLISSGFLVATTVVVVGGGADPIRRTCKSLSTTDPNINYNFCINALKAAPASRCASLTKLGLISLKLAMDNAMDTRCYIKQLMISTQLNNKQQLVIQYNLPLSSSNSLQLQAPPDQKAQAVAAAALSDCYELYSDSILTLKDAARDYKAKRFMDANVKVSSVIDDSVTCEDGFADGGVASPLTKPNNVTFQLSAIALSIINMHLRY